MMRKIILCLVVIQVVSFSSGVFAGPFDGSAVSIPAEGPGASARSFDSLDDLVSWHSTDDKDTKRNMDSVVLSNLKLASTIDDFARLSQMGVSSKTKDFIALEAKKKAKTVGDIIACAMIADSKGTNDRILLGGLELASTIPEFLQLAALTKTKDGRDQVLLKAAGYVKSGDDARALYLKSNDKKVVAAAISAALGHNLWMPTSRLANIMDSLFY
jgi:hypothetical protein